MIIVTYTHYRATFKSCERTCCKMSSFVIVFLYKLYDDLIKMTSCNIDTKHI